MPRAARPRVAVLRGAVALLVRAGRGIRGRRRFRVTAEAPARALRRAVGQGEAAVRLRPRRAGRSAGQRRGLDEGPRRQRHHRLDRPARRSRTSGCCSSARRMAEVRANPDDAAPLVFRAEQNVLLELAESASSPGDHGHAGLGQGAPPRRPDRLRPAAAGLRALTAIADDDAWRSSAPARGEPPSRAISPRGRRAARRDAVGARSRRRPTRCRRPAKMPATCPASTLPPQIVVTADLARGGARRRCCSRRCPIGALAGACAAVGARPERARRSCGWPRASSPRRRSPAGVGARASGDRAACGRRRWASRRGRALPKKSRAACRRR